MKTQLVVAASLLVGLAVSSGGVAAQNGNSPVISTNGTGVCTVTPAYTPGAAGGGTGRSPAATSTRARD